jgi:hypothetical protein
MLMAWFNTCGIDPTETQGLINTRLQTQTQTQGLINTRLQTQTQTQGLSSAPRITLLVGLHSYTN